MNTSTLPLLFGGFFLVPSTHAGVQDTTGEVVGRAPVVTELRIDNQSQPGTAPQVGDDLQANYTFTDVDGDADQTTLRWLRNGVEISGEVSREYQAKSSDVHTNLQVMARPTTDAAITAPSNNLWVTSPEVLVAAANIGSFLGPDATKRDWATANSYCQGLSGGARLPEKEELALLFTSATSGGTNQEMCSKYGWPLINQCQGDNNGYWSATRYGSGYHYYVVLHDGSTGATTDNIAAYVACVR